MGSAAAGLFSAAKSSVRRMEKTTDALSKSPDVTKDQRLGINYVQFFGSKKNAKILKKSLKAIRDSLVATFAIAKMLRSEVSKNVKLIGEKTGKKKGFFGLGLGGLLSLASLLTNPIVLGALGIGAGLIGGGFLLKFLFDNRDNIIQFIMKAGTGLFDFLKGFVSRIVKSIIGDRFKSDDLSNVTAESENRMREDFESLTEGDDGMSDQDAFTQSTLNEIEKLKVDKLEIDDAIKDGSFIGGMNRKEMESRRKAIEKRIKELETGKSQLDDANFFQKKFFGLDKEANINGAYVSEETGYDTKNESQKLDILKGLRNKFMQQGGDPSQIKTVYGQDLINNRLKKFEIPQALDMIRFADKLDEVEGDTSKITADNFEFSDKDTVKPKSLEDLVKTIPQSNNLNEQSGVGDVKTSFNPIQFNPAQGTTDLDQNLALANSSPSANDYTNYDSENYYRESNAAALNIIA